MKRHLHKAHWRKVKALVVLMALSALWVGVACELAGQYRTAVVAHRVVMTMETGGN